MGGGVVQVGHSRVDEGGTAGARIRCDGEKALGVTSHEEEAVTACGPQANASLSDARGRSEHEDSPWCRCARCSQGQLRFTFAISPAFGEYIRVASCGSDSAQS